MWVSYFSAKFITSTLNCFCAYVLFKYVWRGLSAERKWSEQVGGKAKRDKLEKMWTFSPTFRTLIGLSFGFCTSKYTSGSMSSDFGKCT